MGRTKQDIKQVCYKCKKVVNTTKQTRSVPFKKRDYSVVLLVSVCNECDSVLSFGNSEIPKIKKALKKYKKEE